MYELKATEEMSKLLLYEHSGEGQAPFRLHRLVEWAGVKWEDIIHKRADSLAVSPSTTVLAMGQVAQEVTTGVKRNILDSRGYIYGGIGSGLVVPTVHPAFIQRGNARWSAAFINDFHKAMEVAAGRLPPQVADYVLDPSPLDAYRWAQTYREHLRLHSGLRLAFDIETPGKGDDEEASELGDAPDRTWHIDRIGFSYRGLSALSIPWEPTYIAAIRLLLESPGEKVVWNAGFDVPRVRRSGVPARGTIHDGMVAWHILHTDLPKRLGFVATFTCPWQPAWKHLSGAKPAFYNATDADVEWRAMEYIESELKRAGLWDVYVRDVVGLEPLLVHMQTMGMPVDEGIRVDRAAKLAQKLVTTRAEMEACVPLEARKIEHVYVRAPKELAGTLCRTAKLPVVVCNRCGIETPRADHFKVYKKKVNSCAGAERTTISRASTQYYRLADFTPSRDQLVRYHQHHKRPLPTVYDKVKRERRVSFDEANLRKLLLTYPQDMLYSLILTYRSLDKLAGTYIGRPSEV